MLHKKVPKFFKNTFFRPLHKNAYILFYGYFIKSYISMQITNFIFFQKANYIFPSFLTDFFCFSYFTFEKKRNK